MARLDVDLSDIRQQLKLHKLSYIYRVLSIQILWILKNY